MTGTKASLPDPMATQDRKAAQRAEAREFFRASNERIEKHREETLRAIAELRRLAELRQRRRWFR